MADLRHQSQPVDLSAIRIAQCKAFLAPADDDELLFCRFDPSFAEKRASDSKRKFLHRVKRTVKMKSARFAEVGFYRQMCILEQSVPVLQCSVTAGKHAAFRPVHIGPGIIKLRHHEWFAVDSGAEEHTGRRTMMTNGGEVVVLCGKFPPSPLK